MSTWLPPGSKGNDGIDAPQALPGEPAGAAAVEISRSQTRTGGIVVKVIRQPNDTRSPLPAVTEIPPHTKVLFSAVGGKGEPGRKGGSGGSGTPGQNGIDATRDVDATDGSQGGDGGVGGRGSDGGRGGSGGKIILFVEEGQTELLHAIDFDVSGGKGGEPGQHGSPGPGGPGGSGGKAVVWEGISHYKYLCTQYCIGGITEAAVLPHSGDATLEMLRRVARTGPSSSMSNALVNAASTLSRLQGGPRLEGGACRCKGGPAECPACDKKPVYRTFSKPGGRDGVPGAVGAQRLDELPVEGGAGDPGSVDIIVSHKNGDRPKYSSKFRLALASFDVEDGNGDGIFEPGEDIFIRRIRFENKGGMPSPSSLIPCSLEPSDLIESVVGNEGYTHLPTSIPAGNLEFSDKGFRGSIQIPAMRARSVQPYNSEQRISLRAVLPWLKHKLDEFDVSNTITVQFPLELRRIKVPSALAPKFGHVVRWEIFNKSNLAFGASSANARVAKVLFTVNARQGEVQDSAGKWVSSLEMRVPTISPQSIAEMSQWIRVKQEATAYSNLDVSLQLFISTPKQGTLSADPSINRLQLIESHKATIQIAPGHTPSEDDDVLIVTNPAIKKAELEAVQQWLEAELFLKANVWNIGIYGGLLTEDPNDSDVLESILPTYAGKVVIFLGNQFVVGDGQSTSVLKVCDSESLEDACADQTSCLFFGVNNDPASRLSFEELLRPIQDDAESIARSLSEPFRFDREDDLVQCLQRTGGDGCKYHLLAVPKSRLRNSKSNLGHTAKKLAKSLREKVPHSHFVICILAAQQNGCDKDGSLLVWRGLARTSRLEATTSDLFGANDQTSANATPSRGLQRALTVGRRKAVTLSAYDRFCILCSVPFSWRLELLRDTRAHPSLTAETAKLIGLSITDQIDNEIQTFLAETEWPNSIDVREDKSLEKSLPSVYQLVASAATSKNPSPELLAIISYCQASSRPQSTMQSFSQKVVPFGHRRKQLFKHIAKTVEEPQRYGSGHGRLKKPQLFRRSQISLHPATSELSLVLPEGRCVSSSLVKMISEVTGKSQHFQERARYGVAHCLEQNDVVDVDDWQMLVQRSRDHRAEVLRLVNQFQEEQEIYGTAEDGIEEQ